MNAGRVSVVIPVFNTEQFLGDALESVLAQGGELLEILVIDDGSTDGSASVAAVFGDKVRVISQENAGPAAARNRGVRAARGDYITFLDADDTYLPDKFALQVRRLDCQPEIDIVIGQMRRMTLTDSADGIGQRFSEFHDDHLTLSLAACLFRRTVFNQVGLFDEAMRMCDDWDWFMRAREARVPMLIHRHIVLQQRLHAGNMTRQREEGARFILEMTRRSLARRRTGGAATSLPALSSFLEPEEGLTCRLHS